MTRVISIFRAPQILFFLGVALAAQPARAIDYLVGPGQALAELDQVPWEALSAGDRVLVHWRTEPYRAKIILAVEASEQNPFVLSGVPGVGGELPVIDGRNAVTRAGINFWNENRGVIKIGGANNPDCDLPDCVPSWITVENLQVRSGRPPYQFTGRNGLADYVENAASVYVEVGQHVTIRNCILSDSGNGLFIGVNGGMTQDILVEGNHIYDNGIEDRIYEHNSYTSARGIVFQFNHYGPLRTNCPGNNLKDRSAGLVVRYNWIENGNRQLDLVDGEDSQAVPDDPAYRSTFVYGNLLVEADGEGNSQIVHYGGDSGDTSIYRKGTLYFYNNTVVSTRGGNTTLFRLSTGDEHCDCRNNIVYATAGGSRLALVASNGVLDISHNWFDTGWVKSHDNFSGSINDDGTNLDGATPGFVNEAVQDFKLTASSAAVDAAGPQSSGAQANPVLMQYVVHQAGETRPDDGALDMGAFEYCPPGGCNPVDGEPDGTADGGQDAGQGDATPDAGPDAGADEISPADGDGTGGADTTGGDPTAGPQGSCGCGDSTAGSWLGVLLLIGFCLRAGRR